MKDESSTKQEPGFDTPFPVGQPAPGTVDFVQLYQQYATHLQAYQVFQTQADPATMLVASTNPVVAK